MDEQPAPTGWSSEPTTVPVIMKRDYPIRRCFAPSGPVTVVVDAYGLLALGSDKEAQVKEPAAMPGHAARATW
jgi:hypothetical protein